MDEDVPWLYSIALMVIILLWVVGAVVFGLAHLNAQGIGAGLHYPVPLHLTPALASERFRVGQFPVAERLARQILSLPLFPQITEQQQTRVVEVLAME